MGRHLFCDAYLPHPFNTPLILHLWAASNATYVLLVFQLPVLSFYCFLTNSLHPSLFHVLSPSPSSLLPSCLIFSSCFAAWAVLLLLSPAAVLNTHFFHTSVSDSSCCHTGVLGIATLCCAALLWARIKFSTEAQRFWHVQWWKALLFLSKDKIPSVRILQREGSSKSNKHPRKEKARVLRVNPALLRHSTFHPAERLLSQISHAYSIWAWLVVLCICCGEDAVTLTKKGAPVCICWREQWTVAWVCVCHNTGKGDESQR